MTVGLRPRVGRASRRIALLGVSALVFALIPGGVAFAEHFEDTTVLDADSATEASVNWSQFTFDEATDAALGRNDKFPDNLASAVIQGTLDAPLLLTDSDTLSEEVADELERLGVENVHVLGGDLAISEDVVDELEDLGYDVHREAGATRIETAIDIAAAHAPDATEGLLVRAFGDANGDETRAWADALAAGGWAAEEGIPVFLTQTEELNDNLRAYLEDSDIERLTIVGGTAAVSPAVAAELESMNIEVDRVSGANRFATAVAVAAARGYDSAGDAEEVILSEGQASDAWAGGFTAAAYSARSGAPIVLSNGADLPPETVEFLEGAEGTGEVRLVCGPLVEPEACAEAAQILGHEEAAHGNEDFTLTPDEAATNQVSAASPNDNRGARTYTITGLDNNQTYDIALISADRVTNTDGTYTFRDTNSNNVADDTQTDANGGVIEVVNGVAQSTPDGHVNGVTPTNGTITFVVDSTTADSVVPVVFRDADNGDDLDLTAPASSNANPKEPSEEFGVGGQKSWNPNEAAIGSITDDEAITGVDKEGNVILTDDDANGVADATYFYDANDTFRVAAAGAGGNEASTCNPVSMATFEAALSTGDELDQSTVYAPDPEAVSTFCIEDINPAGPATVTATAIDQDTIRVTWSEVAGADSYNIYRVQDTTPGTCSTTLTDYTKIATVPGNATRQYDDNGLNPSTGYCYAVTTVDDGDESSLNGTSGTTTAAAGSTVAPISTDAYVQTDDNNEVSAGDVWRIVFNEQMRPVDIDDRIQVTDAEGDLVNVFCGAALGAGTNQDSEAICQYNTAPVTIAGTEYPAGRVLTVTLGTGEVFTPDNTRAGGDNAVDYPATVTASTGVTDVDGNEWNLADSTDKIIDNEGAKTETGNFAAEAGAPDATAATVADGGANNDTGTVTYNEAVLCTGADPGQFVYDADTTDAGNATVAATAVACDGDNTLVVTFPTGTVDTADVNDGVTYTQSGTAANRVRDFQGNTATSPDTVAATA